VFASIVFGIIIPVALVVGGVISIWRAIVAFRKGEQWRTVGVLLLVAGIGTLALVFVALAPWVGWSDMDYGALILPLVALAVTAVWNAIFLIAAAVATRSVRARETSGDVAV
jgi:uncharacterized membrane protein HdeD (DUF308 family)